MIIAFGNERLKKRAKRQKSGETGFGRAAEE
jgi:hypothetical protein